MARIVDLWGRIEEGGRAVLRDRGAGRMRPPPKHKQGRRNSRSDLGRVDEFGMDEVFGIPQLSRA